MSGISKERRDELRWFVRDDATVFDPDPDITDDELRALLDRCDQLEGLLRNSREVIDGEFGEGCMKVSKDISAALEDT